MDVDVGQSVEIVHQDADKEIEADDALGNKRALSNKRVRKQVRKFNQKNALKVPLAPKFEKRR